MKYFLAILIGCFALEASAQYTFNKEEVVRRKAMAENGAANGRTVDGLTTVWLPVQNWHEGGFEAKEFTMVGCWGMPYGARQAQFGAEFQVNERGCGANVEFCPAGGTPGAGYVNLNALTCAQSVSFVRGGEYDDKILKVAVDATGCEFWDVSEAASFGKAVIEAAKKNFEIANDEDITVDLQGATIQ